MAILATVGRCHAHNQRDFNRPPLILISMLISLLASQLLYINHKTYTTPIIASVSRSKLPLVGALKLRMHINCGHVRLTAFAPRAERCSVRCCDGIGGRFVRLCLTRANIAFASRPSPHKRSITQHGVTRDFSAFSADANHDDHDRTDTHNKQINK